MKSSPDTDLLRVRCPECGLINPCSASACETCGAMLPLFAEPDSSTPMSPATQRNEPSAPQCDGVQPWPWDVPVAGTDKRNEPSSPPASAAPRSRVRLGPRSDLTGRVIIMEPPHQERPDFDWYKFFTKAMWFLLLVASPFLLLHAVLVKLGVLPALLAIAGMIYLLRFITPNNLLSMLYLSTMLNPLRRQEKEMVPVRYVRIRDDNEAEWMARVKGDFCLGNVSVDDLVSLHGKWRGGTLFVTRGYNHRTRSRIAVRSSYSWVGFVITLAVILLLVVYFWEPTRVLMHKVQELEGRP